MVLGSLNQGFTESANSLIPVTEISGTVHFYEDAMYNDDIPAKSSGPD